MLWALHFAVATVWLPGLVGLDLVMVAMGAELAVSTLHFSSLFAAVTAAAAVAFGAGIDTGGDI